MTFNKVIYVAKKQQTALNASPHSKQHISNSGKDNFLTGRNLQEKPTQGEHPISSSAWGLRRWG